MRRREISPEFWTDERVIEVSDAAKLLFIGLWQLADREGRIEDKPKTIGLKLRPWAPAEAPAMLDELVVQGMVRRYQVDGRRLLLIPRFAEHQNVHPKEMASKLPPPPVVETQRQELETTEAVKRLEVSRPAVERSEIIPGSSGSSFPSGPSGSAGPSGPSGSAGSAGEDQPPPKTLALAAFTIEGPDPARMESWSAQEFWKAFELERRANGYPPEKWPAPNSLRDWWTEARSAFDVRVLGMAASNYYRDEHWRQARPPCPWAGFAKQWHKYLPRKAVAS